MINMVRVLNLLILCFILSSCSNKYDEELNKVLLISRLADCEEDNLHLKVIEVIEGELLKEGQWVLPNCISKDCKELIYKLGNRDLNSVFEVECLVSKKGHSKIQYGCLDKKEIEIRVIRKRDK